MYIDHNNGNTSCKTCRICSFFVQLVWKLGRGRGMGFSYVVIRGMRFRMAVQSKRPLGDARFVCEGHMPLEEYGPTGCAILEALQCSRAGKKRHHYPRAVPRGASDQSALATWSPRYCRRGRGEALCAPRKNSLCFPKWNHCLHCLKRSSVRARILLVYLRPRRRFLLSANSDLRTEKRRRSGPL